MDEEQKYIDLMVKLAGFEATVKGRFDSIIAHLATLNGQTSKNSGAIQKLELDDKDIRAMLYDQGTRISQQKKEDDERQDRKEEKANSVKKRWQDLAFGTLQWLIPAIIIGLLVNGQKVAKFLGFIP